MIGGWRRSTMIIRLGAISTLRSTCDAFFDPRPSGRSRATATLRRPARGSARCPHVLLHPHNSRALSSQRGGVGWAKGDCGREEGGRPPSLPFRGLPPFSRLFPPLFLVAARTGGAASPCARAREPPAWRVGSRGPSPRLHITSLGIFSPRHPRRPAPWRARRPAGVAAPFQHGVALFHTTSLNP